MTKTHNHNNLPCGTWVGDPCRILKGNMYTQLTGEYYETEAGYFLVFADADVENEYDELDEDNFDDYCDYEEKVEDLRSEAIWVTKLPMNGDGTYTDQNGNEYVVDSGLLCAIPTVDLPAGTDLSGGHVVDEYVDADNDGVENGVATVAGLTIS